MTVPLSVASLSETQTMSSGYFLVEGTHFNSASSKTHLRTFLGSSKWVPAKAGEAEVVFLCLQWISTFWRRIFFIDRDLLPLVHQVRGDLLYFLPRPLVVVGC